MVDDPEELPAVLRVAWQKGPFKAHPEAADDIVRLFPLANQRMASQHRGNHLSEAAVDQLEQFCAGPVLSPTDPDEDDRNLSGGLVSGWHIDWVEIVRHDDGGLSLARIVSPSREEGKDVVERNLRFACPSEASALAIDSRGGHGGRRERSSPCKTRQKHPPVTEQVVMAPKSWAATPLAAEPRTRLCHPIRSACRAVWPQMPLHPLGPPMV